MAWLNKVMIIGNVGTEPEMRFTPNGTPVTSFRLATNRLFTTSDGERRKETEWFDVITWRKQAESCNQFLSKGQRVYVEGRLRTRSWEGQDGRTQFRVEIQADRVIFLDRRPAAPSELGPEEESEPLAPEELPF